MSQILGTSADPIYLHLPEPTVFGDRAARLSVLAEGHVLAGYLRLLAAIARAQHEALAAMAPVPLPAPDRQQQCREHGVPVLSAHSWPRDPAWHGALRHILASVNAPSLPVQTRHIIERLHEAGSDLWEGMADLLLAGDFADLDVGAAPFIGAALQVYWTRMATALGVDAFGRMDAPSQCPVCGSPPVASVVRIGTEQGLRYACCSLCAAQWHVVRIKCVQCRSTKDIGYYAIAGQGDAVKAEQCSACGTYLKIMYMNKQPDLDPVADDVASVALDVLMAGRGKARGGVNFFLLTGVTSSEEQDSRTGTC